MFAYTIHYARQERSYDLRSSPDADHVPKRHAYRNPNRNIY
jgi:hypothetical protein